MPWTSHDVSFLVDESVVSHSVQSMYASQYGLSAYDGVCWLIALHECLRSYKQVITNFGNLCDDADGGHMSLIALSLFC